jgi:hypothetical protein
MRLLSCRDDGEALRVLLHARRLRIDQDRTVGRGFGPPGGHQVERRHAVPGQEIVDARSGGVPGFAGVDHGGGPQRAAKGDRCTEPGCAASNDDDVIP